MSDTRTFVIVDRNAIALNDRSGSDREAIIVQTDGFAQACHELEILDADGRVVGRFLSQSRGRPVDKNRPHVWFELGFGSFRAVPPGSRSS